MTYNGKCPLDGSRLELQDDTLTCPCGYSILQTNFEKLWDEFDKKKADAGFPSRKAVRKLINDLAMKYRIPNETKNGSEKNQ